MTSKMNKYNSPLLGEHKKIADFLREKFCYYLNFARKNQGVLEIM